MNSTVFWTGGITAGASQQRVLGDRDAEVHDQSHGGERRVERLLSAHITCRLQNRSLFDYLTELLSAHARGDPLPLLA
jgi:hypothetical protein